MNELEYNFLSRPDVCGEHRKEAGSLSPAERQVGTEPGFLRFRYYALTY